MCFQPRTRAVGFSFLGYSPHPHGYQVVIDRGFKCGLNQDWLLYQSLESPQITGFSRTNRTRTYLGSTSIYRQIIHYLSEFLSLKNCCFVVEKSVQPVPLDASSLVKIVTLCIPLTKGVKTPHATVLVILKAKQP